MKKLLRRLAVRAPLEQAERCLALWLKEQRLALPAPARKRAAALVARHFEGGEAPDALILSFLRHYSGARDAGDDRALLRREIAAQLDKARPRRRGTALAAVAIIVALLWSGAHMRASPAQIADLKTMVQRVVEMEKPRGASYPAVWAAIKTPLQVRRYEDMSWLDYRRARAMLEARISLSRADAPCCKSP